MTQQSGSQFDDDLTVGMEDNGSEDNGSFSMDSIDLFEFSGGEESPIAKLKTIILSIDWEINDDILQQLEDELVDLSDIWAGDKIKLIYIQGLSKIGKYIYKEKASAHPNSIKLLITFYHNFEKIVSSGDGMNEEEKKQLLLEDVKKFDQLKSLIGQSATASAAEEMPAALFSEETVTEENEVEELKILKAQVLGIDWEINDEVIKKLSDEVQRLEVVFSQNKAKGILLQGIGALGSYINKMRSQSNSKAFTLLHSFYDLLEKISLAELSPSEEKQLLLAEVAKFKAFKREIATAETAEVQAKPAGVAVAALSSTDEDELPGAESTADDVAIDSLPAEGGDEEGEVASDVASRLASVFGDIEEEDDETGLDKNAALEGVNVETEADDDSDEEALPFEDGAVAPALAEADEESSFSVEKLADDLAQFAEEDEKEADETEVESLLQGVDVETEADDDSGEEALLFEDGEIAPALSGSDDENEFEDESLTTEREESDSDDLDNRLDSFFDDEVQSSSDEWDHEGEDEAHAEGAGEEQELVAALSDVVEDDNELVEEALVSSEEDFDILDDEPAAALSEALEESSFDEEVSEETAEETVEDQLSFFDEDTPGLEPESADDVEDGEKSEDDGAEEQLAFLDEDIAAPESVATEEELQDETEDTESPVIDDTSAPAFSEETEKFSAFEAEEEVAEGTDEALSFLDEEPELPAVDEEALETEGIVLDDDKDELLEDSEGTDEALSFLDEEPELPPADEEALETEGIVLDDDKDELLEDSEDTDEALSFLDEEPELPPVDEESLETRATDSGAVEEVAEDGEIAFTVPGDDAVAEVAPAISAEDKFETDDEIIEFLVPGEDDSIETISDELIFEVVDDDVEVDLLPGEEFVDSSSEFEGQGKLSSDEYESLGNEIALFKGNLTPETQQNMFTEVNRLRNLTTSDYTGKIFLQLLSTIGQNVDKNIADPDTAGLALLDQVFDGIQMNASPGTSSEQTQQHLLTCISQVLLLQQKAIAQPALLPDEAEADDGADTIGSDTTERVDEQVVVEGASETDEGLASFVHGELADIKQLFLDEIRTLRKEIVDK